MEPNQAEVEIAFPIARGALTQSEVCHKELKIQKKRRNHGEDKVCRRYRQIKKGFYIVIVFS